MLVSYLPFSQFLSTNRYRACQHHSDPEALRPRGFAGASVHAISCVRKLRLVGFVYSRGLTPPGPSLPGQELRLPPSSSACTTPGPDPPSHRARLSWAIWVVTEMAHKIDLLNWALKVVGRERGRKLAASSCVGYPCGAGPQFKQHCVGSSHPAFPCLLCTSAGGLNPSNGPEWSDLPAKYPGKQKQDYFTDVSLSSANSPPGNRQGLNWGSRGVARLPTAWLLCRSRAKLHQLEVFIKVQL